MSRIQHVGFIVYVLFSLQTHCTQSQVVLTESGGDVKKPGQTLRLSCKCSGFDSSGYWMHWVRQQLGRGLEWIGDINASGDTIFFSPLLRDRFTISWDNSQKMLHLDMTSLKTEDTALYYCARERGGAYYFDYWGQGTMVTVTAAQKAAPTVFPVASCSEPSPDGFISLGLLATEFLPNDVSFTWRSQLSIDASLFLPKTYPSVISAKGTYIGSSQLLLPFTECQKPNNIFCEVKHSLGKEVYPVICPDFTVILPKVSIFLPATQESTFINLVCLVEGFRPKNAKVTWSKNSQPVNTGVLTFATVLDENKNFTTTSSLRITREDWNKEAEFMCQASHPRWNETVTKNISKLLVPECTLEDVKVIGIAPSIEDILLAKSAHVSCLVYGLLSPEKCNISWARSSEPEGSFKFPFEEIPNENGTFSIISKMPICPAEWNSEEEFTCIVEHESLPTPERVTIKKHNGGILKKPKIVLLPPTSEDLSNSETVTLTCLVKGFSPADLFLKWHHNGAPVPDAEYSDTNKLQDAGNESFSMYSKLEIRVEDWNNGHSFTCIVGHESLDLNVSSKTIDKSSVVQSCTSEDVKVYGIAPSIEHILLAKSPHVSCLVSGLLSPENCNISWVRSTDPKIFQFPFEEIINENGTYSIISKMPICPAEWNSDEEFTCIVEHESLPTPERFTIQKYSGGILKKPKIALLPPTSEDLSNGQTASVTCLVKDFFPGDLFLKWHHNGAPVPDYEYSHTNKLRDAGNESFSMYSKLDIRVEDWNNGHSFTCIVGHESLDLNVSSKTIDKSSGKPSSVNVTVIMSDTACY